MVRYSPIHKFNVIIIKVWREVFENIFKRTHTTPPINYVKQKTKTPRANSYKMYNAWLYDKKISSLSFSEENSLTSKYLKGFHAKHITTRNMTCVCVQFPRTLSYDTLRRTPLKWLTRQVITFATYFPHTPFFTDLPLFGNICERIFALPAKSFHWSVPIRK